MLTRLFVPFLAMASTAVCVGQSADFHRDLTVPNRLDLYVSTGSGTIRITPGSDGHLTVIGHVRAGWGQVADRSERVRRIASDPPIQQTAETVRIGEPADRSLLNNISIDYEIRVPREVALNLRSGSGDLEVDGVGRFLAASTGSGTLRAHGLHGPAQLQTGSGDIDLDETAPGDIRAHTGSGSLRLRDVNGKVEAHSGSGDLEVSGRLEGPGELSSGSGSVRLRLAPESRFDVSASTGSGTIRASAPGLDSSDHEHRHLTGRIGGGGGSIRIHTGSGDIDITSE